MTYEKQKQTQVQTHAKRNSREKNELLLNQVRESNEKPMAKRDNDSDAMDKEKTVKSVQTSTSDVMSSVGHGLTHRSTAISMCYSHPTMGEDTVVSMPPTLSRDHSSSSSLSQQLHNTTCNGSNNNNNNNNNNNSNSNGNVRQALIQPDRLFNPCHGNTSNPVQNHLAQSQPPKTRSNGRLHFPDHEFAGKYEFVRYIGHGRSFCDGI
ncbi:hypothetical protein RFI_04412 [Reticulomyxa filosa]|uniref:Uncharacterized protein n=1 Tax=Reticulomyxa filosa TaxID=46433 RepID=X6P2B7_RETFI|nr:hypothetical protein RFI_04412 [Reticulomyxa filosa]|eukprot:ETO32700.1 hypothetical protein RFI_04412 [Reticulomyxa filosa]